MKKKPIGIVLWEGKSLLDGERIMVIATGVYGKSENQKTGEMVQTYVLRRDFHPLLARRMGEDFSVCGDCMHRELSTCYVNFCHGPISIFHAYLDHAYKPFEAADIELFRGRNIRLGSYGDPAAVPYEVWERISSVANKVTGYTHQWRKYDQRLKNICMASVDTIERYIIEYEKARSEGWRTFRLREDLEKNPLLPGEFICPASKEGGQKTTCEKCGSCGGLSVKTKKTPVIMLHADAKELGGWRHKRYTKAMILRRRKQAWRRDYNSERKQFKKVCKF